MTVLKALYITVCVALKLRSLRLHSPRLCRIAVLLIQTNVSLIKQRRSRRTGQYTDVPNSSLPLLLLVALTRAPCAPSSSSLQSQTPAPLNHRLRVVGMYGSAHTCTCVRVPLRKQTRAHNFIPACTETLCQDSGFAQCLPLRIKNLPRITIKGDKTSVGDFGIY